MGAFAIRMTLLAPVAAGEGPRPPCLMLDGLVGFGVARERFGAAVSARQPHRDVFVDLPLPLDQASATVWAASQGFSAVGVRRTALLTHINDRHAVVEPVKVSPRFGPAVVAIPLWVTPEMVFFGSGDGEAVLRLLRRHITFLGHKRGSGFGLVAQMRLTPLDQDWSIGHWDGAAYVLHRPWPVAEAAALLAYIVATWGEDAAAWWMAHADAWPRAYLAVRPPYHDPRAHQWCFAPSAYGLAETVPWLPAAFTPAGLVPDALWDDVAEDLDEDAVPPWDLSERPAFSRPLLATTD